MKTETTTTRRAAAYLAAAEFIGEDLAHDPAASERAGYPVMMTADGSAWVSDLGTRYEANRADGVTRNFWAVASEAEDRAAEAEREAGEARRAAILAEIERQEAAGETETRAAREARREAIEEARREARRARETVRLIKARAREAREDGDTEAAEAIAARLPAAEKAREAAALALLAVDPRARMTAADFLAMAAEDPEAAASAIAAATNRAAAILARERPEAAAEILARHGEDARQEAWADALALAADPDHAADPLALFLARVAGNALARVKYGEDKGKPSPAVDTERAYLAAAVPGPEAAAIRAEKLPRALAAVREEYRAAAGTIAAALATGYTLAEAAEAIAINYRTAARVLEAIRAAAEVIAWEDGEAAEFWRVTDSDRHVLAMIDRRRLAAAVAAWTPGADAAAEREAADRETAEAAETVTAARAALAAAIASPRRRAPEAKAARAETVAAARAALARAEAEAEAVAVSRHGVTWTPTLDPEARHAAALDREAARFTYREKIAMAAAR